MDENVEIRRHRLSFPCPKDGTETNLYDIFAQADGDIIVNGFCSKCEGTFTFTTDLQKIITHCVFADVVCHQASHAQKTHTKVLRPPLKATTDLSELDRKLLKDAGIEP